MHLAALATSSIPWTVPENAETVGNSFCKAVFDEAVYRRSPAIWLLLSYMSGESDLFTVIACVCIRTVCVCI